MKDYWIKLDMYERENLRTCLLFFILGYTHTQENEKKLWALYNKLK